MFLPTGWVLSTAAKVLGAADEGDERGDAVKRSIRRRKRRGKKEKAKSFYWILLEESRHE